MKPTQTQSSGYLLRRRHEARPSSRLNRDRARASPPKTASLSKICTRRFTRHQASRPNSPTKSRSVRSTWHAMEWGNQSTRCLLDVVSCKFRFPTEFLKNDCSPPYSRVVGIQRTATASRERRERPVNAFASRQRREFDSRPVIPSTL